MDTLNLNVQEKEEVLSNPVSDWKLCSLAVKELAEAVEVLGQSHNHKDALRLVMMLSNGIRRQLTSLRSRLVRDTCESLQRIVKVMRQDFTDVANTLLLEIIGTAKSSSSAIREPGSKLLRNISKIVRYDLALMKKIYVQTAQENVHLLILEQLRVILVFWGKDEVLQYEQDVIEMIRRGLEDQNENVRKSARDAFASFCAQWSERMGDLVNLPSTQSKVLLMREHPDSPLAEAILKNYPEMSRKLAYRSNLALAQLGSRKIQREQKVEISLPKPRKSRKDMDSELMSAEDRSEKNQLEATLEAFGGSHLCSFRPELSTSETVPPLAPEFQDIPSPFPSYSSRSQSPSASTASGEGEAAPCPSGISLKESKIQSSMPRSNELIEVSTSLEQRPPQPPSPNITVQSHRNRGFLSPARGAKFDEERIELSDLSASDEFFSKQIPSSITTSIHLPTDNVTLRSRRQVSVRTDQEGSPLDTYNLKLSPHELSRNRLQRAESIPARIGCKPSSQDMSLSVLDRLTASRAFIETDPIDHLTEGGDHTEFTCEQDYHHWSDYRDGSAKDERDQLKLSAMSGRTLPDEGHQSDEDQDRNDCIGTVGKDLEQSIIQSTISSLDSHDNVRSIKLEYPIEQSCSNQDEGGEEHDELDAETTHAEKTSSDTLEALRHVCENIKSLREVTQNIETKYGGTHEQAHMASTKTSYLEQLQQADQNARNPREQSLLKTFKPILCQAEAFDAEHQQISDNALLDLQTPPPTSLPKFDQGTAKSNENIFNFVEDSHHAASARTDFDAGFLETSQDQELYVSRVDQASRFDAAEKLFAGKETLLVHDCYDRTPVRQERQGEVSKLLLEQVHSPHFSNAQDPDPTRIRPNFALAFGRTAVLKDNHVLAEKVIASKVNEEDSREQADDDSHLLHPLGSNDATALPATTGAKQVDVARPPEASPFNDIPERNFPAARQKRSYSCGIALVMLLSAIFCIAGLLHAARKVNESHAYHVDLKSRMDKFETSIIESHSKVLQLEKDYSTWAEYVRKLAEEDEANALMQLQALHAEVQKWQQDMRNDLEQFQQDAHSRLD